MFIPSEAACPERSRREGSGRGIYRTSRYHFASRSGDTPQANIVHSAQLSATVRAGPRAAKRRAEVTTGDPLHEQVEGPLAPGLTDVLQQLERHDNPDAVRHQLESAIVPVTDQSRRGTLHFLPSGNKVSDPARLLTGPSLDSLAAALIDLDYTYILVDSAPILGIADSLSLARALHHVLFVGRLDRLTLDTIAHWRLCVGRGQQQENKNRSQ